MFTILTVFLLQIAYVAYTPNYIIALTRSHIDKKKNKSDAISLHSLLTYRYEVLYKYYIQNMYHYKNGNGNFFLFWTDDSETSLEAV